eukprot:m51a1_g5670 hypothetical protein (501) ;mRNA; f:926474-928572
MAQQPGGSRRAHLTLSCVQSVSVDRPLKVNLGDRPHVVFRVTSRLSPQFAAAHGGLDEITSLHRYNQFRDLNDRFGLASFPAKSWIYEFEPWFLEQRAKGLDGFLKDVLSVLVTERADTPRAKEFLRFLVSGEHVEERHVCNDRDEDYAMVMSVLQKWSLTPRRFLWRKYVLSLFGSTSSGKSSLVNHLFQIPVVHPGVGQTDVGFSVVETVPENEFAMIAGSASGSGVTAPSASPELSKEELFAPLPATGYGVVFLYLGAQATVQRYHPQFQEVATQVGVHETLLRAVLINEKYLKYLPPQCAELAKRVVVIDSKGIDKTVTPDLLSTNEARLWEPFLKDVAVMSLFYKVCDLALFMVPANGVHSCSAQLAAFELCNIAAIEGATKVEETLRGASKNSPASMAVGSSASDGILATGLKAVSGVFGLYGAVVVGAVTAIRFLSRKLTPGLAAAAREDAGAAQSQTTGNVRWGKTLFALSRIDELLSSNPEDQQTAEMGVL